ncbi:MAG: type I restriction endonuclease subunit R [bacterium]
MKKLNEDTLTEQPVIEWLKELGYDHEFGPDLASTGLLHERASYHQVILTARLQRSLSRLNPNLPPTAIDQAMAKLTNLEHPNLEIANRDVYKLLTHGIPVEVKDTDETKGKLVNVFDYANPSNNEFLVVNQFSVQGIDTIRRPDIVVFINGLPIAVFEVKSPTSQSGTLRSAYNQLRNYQEDIPDLFKYNQLLVIGDLLTAKHGTISSSWERFAAWKKIESEADRPGTSELETLVKGIFHKDRLLDIINNFVVFEADSEQNVSTYTKKMCLYHQYYGVNLAVERTLEAVGPNGNKKIGVFWHTQGSGKSISMVFYVNKIKNHPALNSPTFLFLTDRNDLDGQLHKTFLRTGYDVLAKQANSVNDLKERLAFAGGELLFTTIQKFDGKDYPLLTERHNVIVIADEAHRSQYALLAGNVRQAIPNASFMGITGTPVSLHDRDTRLVFGDHITTYTIDQAVKDGATVPIYYEGRLVPLHLTNEFIDQQFDDLVAEQETELSPDQKRKFARMELLVGADDRLQRIAEDIVQHFNHRGVEGKAMVVTMSRRIAAKMYQKITGITGAPEAAVVISKPEEYRGLIQSETNSKELEKRFKDINDSLKLVIVCDMWLTGFDVPSLYTMYIDKPLKNHTLMQAIARVNRVFRDKEGGLVVDYIGIADDLKKALSVYTSDIQKEAMIPLGELVAKLREKHDVVKAMFAGVEYQQWRLLPVGTYAQLFQQAINCLITNPSGLPDEEKKKRFIEQTEMLFKLFALVMPHPEAYKIKDEVAFFRAVKQAIVKYTVTDGSGDGLDEQVETTLRELVSKSIAADGVVDIFAMREKGKTDISIFDDKFLEELKNLKLKNLAIETLRKLLNDEIRLRRRKNEIRYQSLAELLEAIIEQYKNRIIDSSQVMERLLGLAKKIKTLDEESKTIGLSEEELAFYDIIAGDKQVVKDEQKAKTLSKELVEMIKRDLTVDWINNERIQSSIKANVKRLLLRNEISLEQSELIVGQIYKQALALYRDFVRV